MTPTFGWSLDVTGTRRAAAALSTSFVFAIAIGTAGPASVLAAEYNPATDVNSMASTTDYIGADTWWDAGYTGQGVTVALIDTGVTPVGGLDAPGKIIYGPDLSLESQAPELTNLDTSGHGTFMAGLIAGHDTALSAPYSQAPASAYRGVAPDARILSIKVGTADGGTDVSQVIAAIDWVVQHKNDNGMNIRVLNLSYGTNSTQGYVVDPLSFAVEQAWRAGIVVVAAAGNSGYQKGANAPGLADPAYNPMIIAVGASDSMGTPVVYDDAVASFSANSNACNLACRNPDFIAPGAHIQGLRVPNSYIDLNHPGGVLSASYFRGSGTSESAAITSGAVALVLDKHPTWTPDQIKAFLNQGAAHLAGYSARQQGNGELALAGLLTMGASKSGQFITPATGIGSLEIARGSDHLTLDGVVLTGERDIFGKPFVSADMAALEAAGNSWSGGTWNGSVWTGNSWSGNSWSGNSWSGNSWSGNSWSGNSWSGNSWSGNSWSGNSWSGNSWSGNSWSGNSWSSVGWN
jgi:serine protease AprX